MLYQRTTLGYWNDDEGSLELTLDRTPADPGLSRMVARLGAPGYVPSLDASAFRALGKTPIITYPYAATGETATLGDPQWNRLEVRISPVYAAGNTALVLTSVAGRGKYRPGRGYRGTVWRVTVGAGCALRVVGSTRVRGD
ncbi:MAG: hypothetical protein ABJD11_03735 [Gemmatimonadota bacterium]